MNIAESVETVKSIAKQVGSTIMLAVLFAYPYGHGNGQMPQAESPAVKKFTYEVVAIKLSKDSNSGGIHNLPDGFAMANLTLRSLISDAYGNILDDQITGWPGWAFSTRFDIQAKMDAETADALHKMPKAQQEEERRRMLQTLLEDRFKIKIHHAPVLRTAYELVVAKGGLKMKEGASNIDIAGNDLQEGARPVTDWRIEDGKISGHAMPVSILADHLQGAVNAIVIDKSGLTKRYDIVLRWDSTNGQNPNATSPPIFTALDEQLGLQLKPFKTPLDTIVIDHIEMPTEN